MRLQRTKTVTGNEVHIRFDHLHYTCTLVYDLDLDHLVDIGLDRIAIVKGRNGCLYARYHKKSVYGATALSTILARHLYPELDVHSCLPINGNHLDLRKFNLRVIPRVAVSAPYTDFVIQSQNGFRLQARCRSCGDIRDTTTSNLAKFPRCKRCKVLRDRMGKLSPDLAVVDIGDGTHLLRCQFGHSFRRKDLYGFINHYNRCPVCDQREVDQVRLMQVIPQGYTLLNPGSHTNQSSELVLKCKNDHIYRTKYVNLSKPGISPDPCLYCSPRRPLEHGEVVARLKGYGYDWLSGPTTSHRRGEKVTLRCQKGHEKSVTLAQALYGRSKGCPTCTALTYSSNYEKVIRGWLVGEKLVTNTREVIPPFELDIYLPEKKLAIEFNGSYFHRVEFVGEDRHHLKYQLCRGLGITLLTIFENRMLAEPEWVRWAVNEYASGRDAYADGEEILADNSFPLVRSGYEVIEELPPQPFKSDRYTLFDCGRTLYRGGLVLSDKT